MSLLRTTSTRRLLAATVGLVIAALAGTAIAIAATGSGAVPHRTTLARAVHAALAAPAVSGVTARVTFTNHLIDAADVQGTDPLLSGGSGRVWVSPGHGLRLEIQSDNGDAQLVVTNTSFWAYDPTSSTVYEGTLPADPQAKKQTKSHATDKMPTVAQIQAAIERIAGHVTLTGPRPTDVAGHPAYSERISPTAGGGLLGGAELAWDAARGVPLRFGLYARGSSAPVLELTATNVSYGSVPASVYAISPPSNAKVVKVDLPTGNTTSSPAAHAKHPASKHIAVTGTGPVAAKLSFPLDAPATAGGMARSAVRLLGTGQNAGALISYGRDLGSVAVIEHRSTGKTQGASSAQEDHAGLSLPTVSVAHGASAQELDTALGTVLQFTRNGVSYTVAGFVGPSTARAVANAL
jgi:outer membrane lipoprotein-sorting protein